MTNSSGLAAPPEAGTVKRAPVAADVLAWALFAWAVFMLFTNAIPLMLAVSPETAVTKKMATKVWRLGLLIPALTFGVWAAFRPSGFAGLSLVRFLRGFKVRPMATAVLLFAVYTALMSFAGFVRHEALESRAFDLGIFVQAVWNTTQGDFLYSSIKGGICLLGDHFSPVLALLAPVYALWPEPESLIFMQALAAGSCLLPLVWLAREKTGSAGIALVFGLLYFFYLPTRNALHEDFHPEVLVEVFLILAFIFLEKRRTAAFLLMLAVAVLAKENFWGIAFVFGIYAFFFKGQRQLGAALMIVSPVVFLALVRWIIPGISGQPYLYTGNYFEWFRNPAALFGHLFDAESGEYVMEVFLPFLFLPFFSLPVLLLAAPVLFQNLLSINEAMRSFSYHYTTGMTPFLFIAAIYGFQTVTARWPQVMSRRHWLAALLLFAGLMRSEPGEYFFLHHSLANQTPHRVWVREQLRAVPEKASVLTHNNFIPQLANRREVHQFDYREGWSKAREAEALKPDFVIWDESFWEPGTLPSGAVEADLVALGYQKTKNRNGFSMFKKSKS